MLNIFHDKYLSTSTRLVLPNIEGFALRYASLFLVRAEMVNQEAQANYWQLS